MAAANPNQGLARPRPLPKLIPLDPPGESSEDTPRTVNSDESARQRRRTQQRLARLPTPDGRESESSSRRARLQDVMHSRLSLRSLSTLEMSDTSF